jgi:hypothetical protein
MDITTYLYTLRSCPQKGNWNEFVDRFKLLPMGIYEVDLGFCYLHTLIVVFPCGF